MKLIRQRTKQGNRLAEALSMVSSVQTRTSKSHDYARVFTGLLFALFVVTLLLATMAGTSVYRAVYKTGAEADEYRASLGLLVNIIKSNDTYNTVSVGQGPEGPALVLTETIGTAEYETRIYLLNGSLYQDYVIPGSDFNTSMAVKVADTNVFEFDYTNGVLTVTTDQGSVGVYLRTPQWGDGIVGSDIDGASDLSDYEAEGSIDDMQTLPGGVEISEDTVALYEGSSENAEDINVISDTETIPDGSTGVTTTNGEGLV